MAQLDADRSGEDQHKESVPVITWTLILLNIVIYIADRKVGLFGPGIVYGDLSLRAPEVISALQGGADRFPIVTLFTSMFLHGGLMHLLTNIMFLGVFGPPVEQAVGAWRFPLYYLAWGIFASACHIYAAPFRNVPTLGASGAIGGVLGCFFLLFPSNRIIILLGWLEWEMKAWLLLGAWFLYQIFVPQEGVATWAHSGGFLAGMLTVLVIGGRTAILREHPELIELDDDAP